MTEKKSPNPFINMAREAKARDTKITLEKAAQIHKIKAPKEKAQTKKEEE